MSEQALFIGGPWDGLFMEVESGGGTITVDDNSEDSDNFIVPSQGEPATCNHVTYKSGAYFLGPYVARKIYVLEDMDEEDVEESLSIFMADLWDECAEANV